MVIGSEGFIGKASVSYFTNKGHEVFSADIVENPGLKYYRISPGNHSFHDVFNLFPSLDICINASGSANVQHSFNDTVRDFHLNTFNVLLILEAIRQVQPTCKFINLSSAAVYGNPGQLPICETTSTVPMSPYGWHKLMSENICTEFTEQFDVPTHSLRLFSTYGEGQKKLLFWDVYQKILNSKTNNIELFGTGNETRDFMHISDVIRAIESVIHNSNFDGSSINIATGKSTSIHQAVKILVELASPAFQIRFSGNNKQGDPLNWQADIKKLEDLGFENKVSIEEGLKATWKWMKNQL